MQHNSSSRTPSPSSSPSLAPIDSSPPSSPSLYPIKTPPASPGTKDPFAGSSKAVKQPRIYERHGRKRSFGDLSPFERHLDTLTRAEDATPTRTTRVMDPFSGSAKRHWRPPAYEKKTPTSGASETAGLSSSPSPPPTRPSHASPTPIHRAITAALGDPDDDFCLTEDEVDYPRLSVKSPSKVELEHELWDRQITAAIEKLHGVIDLRCVLFTSRLAESQTMLRAHSGTNLGGHITYIPSSIEELAIRTVLPQANSPSSVPSSPTLSPTPFPRGPSFSPSPRTFTRATTVAAPAFNDAFFRSKDGERLRGTPAARAASLRAIAEQPATRLRRPELHMYLANNTISQLPPELFRVTSLTVLSLRTSFGWLRFFYLMILMPRPWPVRRKLSYFHPPSNHTSSCTSRAQRCPEQAPMAARRNAPNEVDKTHCLRQSLAPTAASPERRARVETNFRNHPPLFHSPTRRNVPTHPHFPSSRPILRFGSGCAQADPHTPRVLLRDTPDRGARTQCPHPLPPPCMRPCCGRETRGRPDPHQTQARRPQRARSRRLQPFPSHPSPTHFPTCRRPSLYQGPRARGDYRVECLPFPGPSRRRRIMAWRSRARVCASCGRAVHVGGRHRGRAGWRRGHWRRRCAGTLAWLLARVLAIPGSRTPGSRSRRRVPFRRRRRCVIARGSARGWRRRSRPGHGCGDGRYPARREPCGPGGLREWVLGKLGY